MGTKYHNLGAQLLLESFGYIRSLERELHENAERINCQILQEWLDGKGRKPTSWGTLVGVLSDIEMGELARKIETSLKTHWPPEFGHPPSPAQSTPLPPKSPYPPKYAAFKHMPSISIAQHDTSDQDIAEHVIAETSVLVTNSEQLFDWDEYGLSLHIPENSLPHNLQQCSIHIKVTIMGDDQLPQDTYLVSAVYSIECVPKCRFSQPLTLEIQHCAKPENASKLCFLKATSIDDHEEGVMFEAVAGNFSGHSSYGFTELDSFSRYGIGQKGAAKERQYCASSFYCEDPGMVHKIHFAITWNTKVHNEAIHRYYDKENAVKGHDQKISFKEDSIRLDIPFPSLEGITTANGGWRITALSAPVIEKEEVDKFRTGKRIPSCQLIAECKTEEPTDLKHSMLLSGAQDPHAAFVIYRRCNPDNATAQASGVKRKRKHSDTGLEDADSVPGPSNPKRSRKADGEPSHSQVTSPPKFVTLLRELSSEVLADWEYIGIALELEQGDLDTIKYDHQECKTCFREMLKLWLKQVDPPPTWSAIIEAIDVLGHQSLAEKLRKKYCN